MPTVREIADRNLIIEAARASLIWFMRMCDPSYIAEPVHCHIAEKLEAVERGEITRLIINMPPRHGKSRITAVDFVAWYLGRNPKKMVIMGSYAATLSELHSKECRRRMKSDEAHLVFPDSGLDPLDASVKDWATVAGGRCKATGVSGDITGRGADLLIVDDPHANAAESRSITKRNTVWNWYLSDAYSRLSPTGAVIIIMTRWHTDDLVGRLIDPERLKKQIADGATGEIWETVNFPAITDEKDPLNREPGQALSPHRYGLKRLKNIRATVTKFMWSALYKGQPVPDGGQYIEPECIKTLSIDEVPKGLRWVRYWDVAASEKKINDFTAGPQCAIDDDGNLIISNMVRYRHAWPKSRKTILYHAGIDRCEIGFEAVAGFITAFDNLVEEAPDDIALECFSAISGDKLTRALGWFTLAMNGKVYMVEGPWNGDFLDEVAAFPDGRHDDQIDGVSGAYQMLTGGTPLLLA